MLMCDVWCVLLEYIELKLYRVHKIVYSHRSLSTRIINLPLNHSITQLPYTGTQKYLTSRHLDIVGKSRFWILQIGNQFAKISRLILWNFEKLLEYLGYSRSLVVLPSVQEVYEIQIGKTGPYTRLYCGTSFLNLYEYKDTVALLVRRTRTSYVLVLCTRYIVALLCTMYTM